MSSVGLWIWGRLSGQPAPPLFRAGGLRVVLIVLALAVVPATIGELRAARSPRDTPIQANPGSLLRPLALATIGLALLAIVSAGMRGAGPAWKEWHATGKLEAAQWSSAAGRGSPR
jgi:hypothetical protein